ncbi:MAG: hypothetical protein RL362_1463 [Bacteroidota bacterium]|jgi:hypothetical protein
MKKIISLFFLFTFSIASIAQSDTTCACRTKVPLTSVALGLTSYYFLNDLWYSQYPQSNFHFFNDNKEWLQMDKVGHAFTSYQIGNQLYPAFLRTGYNEKESARYAALTGWSYMMGIEILDGFSTQWGFSPYDILANSTGSFLYWIQQEKWGEQKINLKFSYYPTRFSKMNPAQLGENFQQRILKDYNGQTYWLSLNSTLFFNKNNTFRDAINFNIGYSTTEMIRAKTNNNLVNNFHPTREILFSFDADLNRVKWKRKGMKKVARILSVVKIPLPALEIRGDGKLKFHSFYF